MTAALEATRTHAVTSRARRGDAVRGAAVAVLIAAVLAGCGSSPGDQVAATDRETPTGSAPDGPSPRNSSRGSSSSSAPTVAPIEQLRFSAETVEGAAFDGSSLAGQDAVLWFWAPWCTECREAPHVAAVQRATAEQAVFVGVAGLGPVADMQAFVEDYQVGAFEHLADLDGTLWQRFGVIQQPAYAFIDDSGAVEVVRGELGEEALAAKVADLTTD